MTTSEWTKLTRADLTVFHTDMRDIIMDAMERGGLGRISSKGHAILRSPNGTTTMSVPSKPKSNRNLQNCRADFNRLFGDTEPAKKAALPPRPATPTPAILAEKLPCFVKTCGKTFQTKGARYSHHEIAHHPCQQPGCPRVFPTPQGASLHRRRAHEGFNPGAKPKKEEPEVAQAPAVEVDKIDDSDLLAQVRILLGVTDDAEVARLREELDTANKRIKELDKKLQALRDALQ